jgi:predicted ATPase
MLELISIRNFKAFGNLDAPLSRLNVLSGLNGSGKSTVLQALALLRQSFDVGFIQNKGLVLNGELVELGVGSDVLHENHEKPIIEIGFRSDWRKRIRVGEYYSWIVKYDRAADVLALDQMPLFSSGRMDLPRDLFGDCFQYLRADRINPMVSYPKSHHVVSERRFLGSRGEYTAYFLSKFRDQPVSERLRRSDGESATPGLLSQVNLWMQEFSPGVRVGVEEVDRTDFVRLHYSYGSSRGLRGSDAYRPTNVGFGLTYSLPIVVACLSSPAGSLLLLENPEAHLHPQGQAAMGKLLAMAAAAGVQIIVETHSDHVLNGIRIAIKEKLIEPTSVNLHFFRRELDENQPQHFQPKINDRGRLDMWPAGFFDQWEKSLDRILD